MNKFQTREDVIKVLRDYDNMLESPQYIEIGGNASRLLLEYSREHSFPGADEIELIKAPADFSAKWQLKLLLPSIQYEHQGEIALFEDYEERLIEIHESRNKNDWDKRGRFQYLKVQALSLQDWAVSRLYYMRQPKSPQLADLWKCGIIPPSYLEWIADNIHRYCGDSDEAMKDLNYAMPFVTDAYKVYEQEMRKQHAEYVAKLHLDGFKCIRCEGLE
jgi:hypothetical protein